MKRSKREPSICHRRPSRADKREKRRLTQNENAFAAVGKIKRGCEIYGLTKGQFSLINLIEVLLDQTGPADVAVSTWTAAGAEIKEAYRLMKNGAIRSLRFLVDFSFKSRKQDYCLALRETFGDDCIRVTKNHAKFILIRNKKWNLAIRTSMNLNENPRNENFEISDDKGLADFLERFLDDIWKTQKDGDVFGQRPIWHVERFNEFGINADVEPEGSPALGVTLDDASRPGFSGL